MRMWFRPCVRTRHGGGSATGDGDKHVYTYLDVCQESITESTIYVDTTYLYPYMHPFRKSLSR